MARAPTLVLTVPQALVHARLDLLLSRLVPGLSRRRAALLIAAGEVTVDGRTGAKGETVLGGAEIALWRAPAHARWTPCPDPLLSLSVLYEDALLLAIDKPSGVPSVPLSADETGTLANAIAARYPECRALGRSPGDGGLLHRLDTETSGVVLAARTTEAFEQLFALQAAGRIEKRYLALVARGDGTVPPQISEPLGPAGRGRQRMRIDPKGRMATTSIEKISAHGDCLLITATIHRGQRHQIRAHLASTGHPLAGDQLYGGPALPGLARLFLHAAVITLPHPGSGAALTVTCPLPPQLSCLLA